MQTIGHAFGGHRFCSKELSLWENGVIIRMVYDGKSVFHKRNGKKDKGRRGMQDLGNTQYFKVEVEPETGVKVVLSTVYEALSEKGYNPVNQIVGYIMSGDPTYITSHKNARSLIMKVERDELVEEMLKEYIKANGWK